MPVVNGKTFPDNMDDKIIKILLDYAKNRRTLFVDSGDINTGQSYGEEYDVEGIIGFSTGEKKVPLLCPKNSMGGSPISNIVAITDLANKKVLYVHPDYKPAYEWNNVSVEREEIDGKKYISLQANKIGEKKETIARFTSELSFKRYMGKKLRFQNHNQPRIKIRDFGEGLSLSI